MCSVVVAAQLGRDRKAIGRTPQGGLDATCHKVVAVHATLALHSVVRCYSSSKKQTYLSATLCKAKQCGNTDLCSVPSLHVSVMKSA
jgi:hypothetical protein